MKFIQVSTTTNSKKNAEQIARLVIKQRLAACVHIIHPVQSVYRWEGKIQRSKEWLLIMKTSEDKFERLRGAIEKLHVYDTPEIIALPIQKLNVTYARWMGRELLDK